jgi:hypothetical protein
MKNQYFGDVNDYLKYGFLRAFADAGLRVGVCWMLTPDDGRTDGGKVGYLSQPATWRGHDPQLFDALSRTVGAGAPRSTSLAEADAMMVPGARFFSATVPDGWSHRRAWFRSALDTLKDADLIFFDPDNGMEVASKGFGATGSQKYLYWTEVEATWSRGKSLLIFQHFARVKRELHIEQLVDRLATEAAGAAITALQTPHVLFLLVTQPSHHAAIEVALERISSTWAGRVTV